GTAAVGSIDFFNPHFEANNLTLGTAPIFISSSGGGSIACMNFWGGACSGQVSGRSIDLDNCSSVAFNRMQTDSIISGFLRQTANTTNCVFIPIGTGDIAAQKGIDGATGNGAIASGSAMTGMYAKTIANGATAQTGFKSGVLVITDRTHNRTALISLNGSANT